MVEEMTLEECFKIVLYTTRGNITTLQSRTFQKRIQAADKLEKFLRDMNYGAALPIRDWNHPTPSTKEHHYG